MVGVDEESASSLQASPSIEGIGATSQAYAVPAAGGPEFGLAPFTPILLRLSTRPSPPMPSTYACLSGGEGRGGGEGWEGRDILRK